ncbi:MAG TPA: hypothetical protein VGO49_00185 [Bradyrhizobium sp.]|jgi:hypothetical protein|nr:hypothetical protein [Bradyrhizobium sp.]
MTFPGQILSTCALEALRRILPPRKHFMASMKLVWVAAAVVGLAIAASTATSFLVAQRASHTAGSAPYCIQVADEKADYKPARTLFELSGLRMWAKRESGMYMQHHAILVVGDEMFHWSYRNHDFVAGVINGRLEGYGPTLTCVPKHNFIGSLPMVFARASEHDYIRFTQREAYRIPKTYQSQWSGGSSRFLYLTTVAPDFLRLQTRWADLPPHQRDSNWVSVTWKPAWLLSSMEAAPGGEIVEQSTEFGLQKSKIVSYGRDSKKYEGYRYLVYADGRPKGVNTTLITCGTPSEMFPRSCQHRFLNNGRHFYFRHRPEDVPNWQGMQKRLLDLFASFEVQSADMPLNQ